MFELQDDFSSHDMAYVISRAKEAATQRNIATCLYCTRRLVELFYTEVPALLEAVRILVGVKCYGAADDVLDFAEGKFLGSPDFLIARATLYADRGKWDQAFDAWENLIKSYPDQSWGFAGKAETLRKRQDYEGAERIYSEACTRWSNDSGLAWWRAFICHYSNNWTTAADRWKEYTDRWPDHGAGYSGAMCAARNLGLLDEAQAIADREAPRFGHLPYFAAEIARLAMARHAWDDALQIWERLTLENPTDEGVVNGLAETRFQRSLWLADRGDADQQRSSQAVDNSNGALSDSEIVLKFESMGQDCEFGLFQRAVGQEPIGLLRWSSTSIPQLITALNERFERMGNDDTTQLVIVNGELYYKDLAYGLNMHTFIEFDKDRESEIKKTIMKRTKYLIGHLVRQIEGNDKIFVYKDRPRSADFEIINLFEALRKLSRVTLVVVQVAGSGETPFSLSEWRPGLWVCKIDRFGNGANGWDVPIQSWLLVCRSVYERIQHD